MNIDIFKHFVCDLLTQTHTEVTQVFLSCSHHLTVTIYITGDIISANHVI